MHLYSSTLESAEGVQAYVKDVKCLALGVVLSLGELDVNHHDMHTPYTHLFCWM